MTKRSGMNSQAASQSALLMDLVEGEGLRLFNDGCGRAYAATEDGRTWTMPSPPFASWLRNVLYRHGSAVARGASIEEAVETLVARALYGQDASTVFVRVARLGDTVYVDLGDPSWSTVEITRTGWQLLRGGSAPVRFVRPSAMEALPLPATGGRLEELRDHINLEDDDEQWSLVAAFLISAFVLAPRGPFPILIFHGEQGCTKTTASAHCAALLDPRRAGLRALPRDLEQLAVAADNGFLLAFDNVSRIEPALSDGLCRLATGAGYARRTHYQNREETIFDAARPILMNGIGQAAVRADLLDRAVLVELPPVPVSRRRLSRDVATSFREARPRILGAIFDAVALALRNQESAAAALTNLPRMADFTVVGAAAEPAMGVAPGTFLRAYAESLRFGAETAAGADPFALALRDLVSRHGPWEGSASELVDLLDRPAHVHPQHWPTNATRMGNRLVRIRPTLPSLGIEAEQLPRSHDFGRRWRIQACAKTIPLEPVTLWTDAHDGATPRDTAGVTETCPESGELGGSDARDTSPRPVVESREGSSGAAAGGVSPTGSSEVQPSRRAAGADPRGE
jgi:hypothetical protein